MAMQSERDQAALERLSALVDGEIEQTAAAQVCGQWRERVDLRSSWHAYQLIGDVMRSDDLACEAARDAEFLATFRMRMATEPVVLAPDRPDLPDIAQIDATVAPLKLVGAARSARWRWMAPSAVAAGFVAVAGVLLLTRAPSAPPEPLTASAGSAASTANLQLVTATSSDAALPASEPQALVANGRLIRDARLDQYLAAHKQFAGSSALGVPSAFMRNATATETER